MYTGRFRVRQSCFVQQLALLDAWKHYVQGPRWVCQATGHLFARYTRFIYKALLV